MAMAIKRGIIVGCGFIFQILISLLFLLLLGKYFALIELLYSIISILLVLYIIKESNNLSFILPWVILIMALPIFGALLYLVLGRSLYRSKTIKKINKQIIASQKYLKQDAKILKEIENNNYDKLKYLSNYVGYPVTKCNNLKYYELGEKAYQDMLKELKSAKEFIFIEYFIINNGQMWQGILDILEEKANNGVDVRVIYDDMGCIAMLPSNYAKILASKNIKCIAFNELKPFLGLFMNNRDHRKIMVIDGLIAFSGGINLSDEYINVTHPFGEWKDNAIRIKGDAVWNFTVMFLTMWNSYYPEDKDFTKYLKSFNDKYEDNGYVVPYGDSPLDHEIVGENVYLNIINQAKKYVYIYTPYLIIDTDMINSLILAAKRGVDVRIIVPGIPDKKIVYELSSSYFQTLIKNGVKIYKYSPGFVHSKVFLSDDDVATVGTINMDYRSLYLHFECGVLMQNVNILKDIKKDFTDSFEKSHLVTKQETHVSGLKRIWQSILRLFAPFM